MTQPESTEKPPRKPFPTARGGKFGTLQRVFDDVWWTWGTTRFFAGAAFPRNMTIVREPDGLVAVHPVMMPSAVQDEVDALGEVRHIVRLGDFHGMDDALYVERYGAKTWAPPDATAQSGVKVDAVLTVGGPLPLADATLVSFATAKWPETVIHLRRHGGILLTCDSLQNWSAIPPGCSFIGSLMARAMGFRGGACIGPGWRRACEPADGAGFGPTFREILDLEFRHFVSAHGPPRLDTAKDDLRAAVDRLYPA